MFAALLNIFAGILLLLLSLGVLYSTFLWWNRRRINLPSPSCSNYFMGHAAEMQRFEVETFTKWANECGLIFKIYVFHYVTVVASDHRWIREFCNNPKYPKPKAYEMFLGNLFGVRVMGSGLVTNTDHSTWLKHRLMLNPAFTKPAIAGLVPLLNDCIDGLLKQLRITAERHDIIDVYEALGRVTMDAIANSAFGMHVTSRDARMDDGELRRCISMYFRGEASRRNDPLLNFKPHKWRFINEVRRCCHELRAIGQRCIADRFKLLLSNVEPPNDALSMLMRGSLEAAGDGQLKPADVEWIIDEFVTLFVAGHDTVATLMTVVLYELSRHPDVYTKVLDELDTVLGQPTADTLSKVPGPERLVELRYLEQVIKEALRLHPPASGTVRYLDAPITFSDVYMPAGTHVLLYFQVAQRWPAYFDRPDEFVPERFDPSYDESRVTGTFTPFSLGPRICIGKDFAMTEAKLLLARLLHEFTYDVLPEPKFELEIITTMRPKAGLSCRLAKRAT